jgi:N-acetylglucosaminyldiphosphoundecaprenol N-acetyl-beta-D-mannosaminyltransferase
MKQSSTSCNFFGITVDGISADDVISRIESSPARPFWIVTANPEILLFAKRNPSYAETLKRADLRIVDGFGLSLVGRLRGARLKRTTGVDLAERLARWAAQKGLSVALIGGEVPDVEKRALRALQARIPGLRGFTEAGGRVTADGEGDEANEEAKMRISLQDPGVIFVAFGHPKQERWIERGREDFPNARAIIGVGGTFNYWAGVSSRAPGWIRAIGLEWLYRLFTEPKRWKRIWDAVVAFPIMALLNTLKNDSQNDRVKNFHRQRRMFCIFQDHLHIAEPNLDDSHSDWFKREGWTTGEQDELTKRITRGFVRNGDIYFYSGDFIVTEADEANFFAHLSEIVDVLHLHDDAHVYGGMIKEEVGRSWKPRKVFGNVKRPIK